MRRSHCRPRRHCRLPMRRRCSADSARRRRSHRCRRSPSPPAAASSRCRSLRRRKTKNPEEPPPPAAGDETAVPGDAAKAAPPPLPPLKLPLEHGLVAVINDPQTHLTTIRWIDIAPQRPRRYVQPKVAYDFDAGRLRIRVQPQDKSLLPPGKVHVHADLVPPPPAGTQTRLDGEMTAPDYEAELYADIIPDPGKTLTLRISIDGYPRAFVYHVPLGAESPDVPESLDLREVRILLPLSGAAYKAPIDSIPVDFEVDSPLGAFNNPDDVLEMGIDVNRQRDLRGDKTVRLNTDRAVGIGIDRMAPNGMLTLEARVGDFHQFPVPVPGLRNARVELLGRIFAGGQGRLERSGRDRARRLAAGNRARRSPAAGRRDRAEG